MRYLLDSNILIALALNTNTVLNARAGACAADDIVTSAIVFAEVLHGSERGLPPDSEVLAILRDEIPVLPFDEAAARIYAGLPFRRASYDRLIAAHTLSLGLVLVTANVTDFADVPELMVENWTV